jgi:hypothetical protein
VRASGKQTDEQPLDQVALTDDDPRDLLFERRDPRRMLTDVLLQREDAGVRDALGQRAGRLTIDSCLGLHVALSGWVPWFGNAESLRHGSCAHAARTLRSCHAATLIRVALQKADELARIAAASFPPAAIARESPRFAEW